MSNFEHAVASFWTASWALSEASEGQPHISPEFALAMLNRLAERNDGIGNRARKELWSLSVARGMEKQA